MVVAVVESVGVAMGAWALSTGSPNVSLGLFVCVYVWMLIEEFVVGNE